MTDIIEEARKLLASINDRDIYIDAIGVVLVDEEPIEANGNDPDIARFVGNSQCIMSSLVDECDRLRSEADRHALIHSYPLMTVGGWRTIGSAPVDGTMILVCRRGASFPAIACWLDRHSEYFGVDGRAITWHPEFWMPLPEVPR